MGKRKLKELDVSALILHTQDYISDTKFSVIYIPLNLTNSLYAQIFSKLPMIHHSNLLLVPKLKQQTTTLSISCKQTHLFAMRLDDRLKLDGAFAVQDSGRRRRSCDVFITNLCVCPSVFICVSGDCLYLIFIFLLCTYDVALVCVCLTCDSLFVLVWVCLCLCLARTSNQTMFFKMSAAHLITSSWYSSMQCRHFFPTFSTDGSSCWKISALWCRHRMSAVEGWRVKQSQLQVFV